MIRHLTTRLARHGHWYVTESRASFAARAHTWNTIPLTDPLPGVRPESPCTAGEALAWSAAERTELVAATRGAGGNGQPGRSGMYPRWSL
ncbi:hypothetical protein [Phytohabitans houttuyneae]|uniref:Uncharacterized protein n=1 Tax=Phytohabitans houttuyneae TaxID=1076126 RepID=A0A6V8KB45_9ACTN|nr:hypothetical protein [Phytohabitans houttuyneae]GFJ77985.1 hypothetical protein Phou_021650 [Phytohabitans houttuyneae]